MTEPTSAPRRDGVGEELVTGSDPERGEPARADGRGARTPVPPSRRPEWVRPRPDGRTILAVAVVAVVFGATMRAQFRRLGPAMEEGFMLVFPEQILHGRLPHQDFLHLYGPGSLWALAGWYRVVGVSLTAERVFGMLQLAGIVAGMVALARPWGRWAMMLVGFHAAVLTTTAVGLAALAWDGAVAMVVVSLWAGLRARRWLDPDETPPDISADTAERHAGRWSFVAGLLAGLGLLFRPDIVLAVGLVALVLGIGVDWRQRARWLAGCALGVLPYLVLFAQVGPGTAIEGMVTDPVFKLRGGRSLPRPPSWGHLDGILQAVVALRTPGWFLPAISPAKQTVLWFYLLPLSVAMLLVVGVLARRRRGDWRSLVMLGVGAVGLGLLPQAMQRPDATHLSWVSCVPVAFLPAALVEVAGWWRGRTGARTRRRATVVTPVGMALAGLTLLIPLFVNPNYTLRWWGSMVAESIRDEPWGFPVRNRGRVFYVGSRPVASAAQRMLDDIDHRVKEGDRVITGPVDLRKTPYSDAYLYFLLPQARPGTRYIEMDPGMANTADSGLDREVARADWLILSRVWEAWDEPNESRRFGSDAPNRMVRRHFCKVGTYQGGPGDFGEVVDYFEVYRRCR